MEIRTFHDPALSQYSYLVADSGRALIIDPRRDIEEYLAAAAEMRVTIEHILLTHIHADFASGHARLAAATGAPVGIGEKADVTWPAERLEEGARLTTRNAEIRVIRTPGHTPEHVCYELTDRASSVVPLAVFTGDTLFAGDVGRPDLFGAEHQDELTAALFSSLARFRDLPDHTLVYPAHGMGSLCGKRLFPRHPTTIGYEKHANELFQATSSEDFRRELLADLSAPPPYYFTTAARNRSGAGLDLPPPRPLPLSPAAVRDWNGIVVDLRDQAAFAAGHVPGSLNLAADAHLATTAGFGLPPDARICLVGAPDEVARGAATLYRMGHDGVAGFLLGGLPAWRESGLPTAAFPLLTPSAAAELTTREDVLFVDVRSPGERVDVRIGGTFALPVSRLGRDTGMLPRDRTILLHCGHGCRASLAASLLLRAGFTSVANLAGGIVAWRAAGLPVET